MPLYNRMEHIKRLKFYVDNYTQAMQEILDLNPFDLNKHAFEYKNIDDWINQLLRYYTPIHTLKVIADRKKKNWQEKRSLLGLYYEIYTHVLTLGTSYVKIDCIVCIPYYDGILSLLHGHP